VHVKVATDQNVNAPPGDPSQGLSREVLKTSDVVFMVMAAAAPMAVVVALMPLAFAFGNGAGVPGTYLAAVVAMLLFAVGYVRIIPHVRNAGAFYAYIAASFGKVVGLPAAYIATVSYFALSCSTIGALSFFSEELFRLTFGINSPWEFWGLIVIIAIAIIAYRRITLAAAVLTVALIAEIVLLLLLDGAVVMNKGISVSSFSNFDLSVIAGPGLGIAVIYAFSSLLGIEGTAIYQEEAKDGERTVPRATYISIIAIGGFYVLTGWCLVLSVGVGDPRAISDIAGQDPGRFLVKQITQYMGDTSAIVLSWLVVTSAFAASLALFNNSVRYLYALARDGVLPSVFGRTHPVHQSPDRAVLLLGGMLLVVFLVASLAGLDPLLNISTALVGVGSVGLMALLATTSLGIPVFFAKRGTWGVTTTLAPAIGGVAIFVATCLAVRNYPALTGIRSGVINYLPFGLLAVAVIGVTQALWLRSYNPSGFDRIGASRVD
jgi:amino acid transporter